jgi:hypothetical protein
MTLVREYPKCFRSKVDRFEDLLVAILQIGLRRTDKVLAPAVSASSDVMTDVA